MKLVVISPPVGEKELPHLSNLFGNGLEAFHLRKPQMPQDAYRSFIEKIDPVYHPRIMIHSHHGLVRNYKLKGIHYTEKSRPIKLVPAAAHVRSTSFHDLKGLAKASVRYEKAIEYAFLSPLFDSISKLGYTSANFDKRELRQALEFNTFPVYALGGVTAERIREIRDLGFKGAAVLGAIWETSDPTASFVNLMEALDNASVD